MADNTKNNQLSLFYHSGNIGDKSYYNTKEIDIVFNNAYYFLKEWVLNKQGTVIELIDDLTLEFGPFIRMEIFELIKKLREDPSTINLTRSYIDTELTFINLASALQGHSKKKVDDLNTLDELFANISEARYSDKFLEVINFVSRLTEYAPFNNMLVYLQRPTAMYWATVKNWKIKFKRTVKEDSIPIIMLRPGGPIMVIYEINDTEGPDLPENLLQPFKVQGTFNPKDLMLLIKFCVKEGIIIKGRTFSGHMAGRVVNKYINDNTISFLIELNKDHSDKQQFVTLCHELAHIFLGHLGGDFKRRWPSRIGLSRSHRELEAESVTYIICKRKNLTTLSADYLAGYLTNPIDKNIVSLEMIMKVAGRIEKILST